MFLNPHFVLVHLVMFVEEKLVAGINFVTSYITTCQKRSQFPPAVLFLARFWTPSRKTRRSAAGTKKKNEDEPSGGSSPSFSPLSVVNEQEIQKEPSAQCRRPIGYAQIAPGRRRRLWHRSSVAAFPWLGVARHNKVADICHHRPLSKFVQVYGRRSNSRSSGSQSERTRRRPIKVNTQERGFSLRSMYFRFNMSVNADNDAELRDGFNVSKHCSRIRHDFENFL